MHMSEYLTTKEVAEFLRLKERKIYDLAANGTIPCSRATGKLLFPRAEVEAWLEQYTSGAAPVEHPERPKVFLGSHDPLLDWALRESGCGLATYFDSSLDGLERYARGEGIACGMHVLDDESDTWNTTQVADRLARQPAVLIGWAWRQRGLVVDPGRKKKIKSLADLRGLRLVPRQSQAGSQVLLEVLLSRAGIASGDIELCPPALTEADAALAVVEGKADAAFGLAALAAQYRLGFVNIIDERYDLLVDRRAYFEPELQKLFGFCRSAAFSQRAGELAGYDVAGFGQVHFNGE